MITKLGTKIKPAYIPKGKTILDAKGTGDIYAISGGPVPLTVSLIPVEYVLVYLPEYEYYSPRILFLVLADKTYRFTYADSSMDHYVRLYRNNTLIDTTYDLQEYAGKDIVYESDRDLILNMSLYGFFPLTAVCDAVPAVKTVTNYIPSGYYNGVLTNSANKPIKYLSTLKAEAMYKPNISVSGLQLYIPLKDSKKSLVGPSTGYWSREDGLLVKDLGINCLKLANQQLNGYDFGTRFDNNNGSLTLWYKVGLDDDQWPIIGFGGSYLHCIFGIYNGRWGVKYYNSNDKIIDSTIPIDDKWHFAAITFYSDQAMQQQAKVNYKLYIDGNLVGFVDNVARPESFAYYSFGHWSGYFKALNKEYAGIRSYNRALNAEEIQEMSKEYTPSKH